MVSGGEPEGVGREPDVGRGPGQGILASVLQTCKQQAHSALDFVSQTLRASGNPSLPRPILLATR